MSRYARRKDTTHAPIVRELRKVGVSVLDLSRLGDDAPDLLVGLWGVDVQVELKSPKRIGHYKGDGRSDGQIEHARTWKGAPVIRAETVDEILAALRNQA